MTCAICALPIMSKGLTAAARLPSMTAGDSFGLQPWISPNLDAVAEFNFSRYRVSDSDCMFGCDSDIVKAFPSEPSEEFSQPSLDLDGMCSNIDETDLSNKVIGPIRQDIELSALDVHVQIIERRQQAQYLVNCHSASAAPFRSPRDQSASAPTARRSCRTAAPCWPTAAPQPIRVFRIRPWRARNPTRG